MLFVGERKALELQQTREQSAIAAKEKEAQVALEQERNLAEERHRQAEETERKLLDMRRKAETQLIKEKASIYVFFTPSENGFF